MAVHVPREVIGFGPGLAYVSFRNKRLDLLPTNPRDDGKHEAQNEGQAQVQGTRR